METTIKEIIHPIWKREEPILVSKEDIVGEVAKWAIRQAPTNESLSNPESEKTSIMVGLENLYQGLEKLHKRLGEIKPFKGLGLRIPEGYLHYITEHSLVPDTELITIANSESCKCFIAGPQLSEEFLEMPIHTK